MQSQNAQVVLEKFESILMDQPIADYLFYMESHLQLHLLLTFQYLTNHPLQTYLSTYSTQQGVDYRSSDNFSNATDGINDSNTTAAISFKKLIKLLPTSHSLIMKIH